MSYFCSLLTELYSSQTSSSFPPSEGFATPNSYTNDMDMKEKLNDDDNALDNDAKVDKLTSKPDKLSTNNKSTKNGKEGCYQCQFCDKSFPRLGYLKKHEQVSSDKKLFLVL